MMQLMGAETANPKPVEVPPWVHEGVKRLAASTRLSQKDLVGLVLEWFIRSDIKVQSAILGRVPDTYQADYARMLLEKMASEPVVGSAEEWASDDDAGAHVESKPQRKKRRKA